MAASHCFYFSPETPRSPAKTFPHANMSVFPVGLLQADFHPPPVSLSTWLIMGWDVPGFFGLCASCAREFWNTLQMLSVSSCRDPEFCLFSLMSNAFPSLADNFWSVLKMKTVSGAAALSQLRSLTSMARCSESARVNG